jgi:hypothetical protein
MADESFDPSEHVGESVTLSGTAWSAAAGAMVRVAGYNRPIYIDGLRAWDKDIEGNIVEVTGVLRLRKSQVPRGDETDVPAHGLPSATFVLDGAEWARGDG